MSGLPMPDFAVHVSRRRLRCVLDPNLALSRLGATFARRLASCAEVWLGTEFLNILDSARLYQREPDLLALTIPDMHHAARLKESLQDWARLRDDAGHTGSPLYWIGDLLRESSLPEGIHEDVVTRWEVAVRGLDGQLPHALEATGPLIAAMRDTVALCAVLPAAILTLTDARSRTDQPILCRYLAEWGIACRKLDFVDELAAIERDSFRRILVQAGLSDFLWAGLDLVVLHVHAPAADRPNTDNEYFAEDDGAMAGDDLLPAPQASWHDACGFWYSLQPESHFAR